MELVAVDLITTPQESAQKVAGGITSNLQLDLSWTRPIFTADRQSLVFSVTLDSLIKRQQSTFPLVANNRIKVHCYQRNPGSKTFKYNEQGTDHTRTRASATPERWAPCDHCGYTNHTSQQCYRKKREEAK